MSTYTGLKCHTCDKTTDVEANHHAEDLAALAREGAPMIRKARELGVDEIRWLWWYGSNGELCDFLVDHEGHDVRPYDEYGYDYDRLGVREDEPGYIASD